MADPYKILGVSKGVTEKDVKTAYRKLAKEFHPDYNKDNPKASERFSEITQAYDLLSDKDKRARFDRGEIDMAGNPTAPFGFGGPGGGQRGAGPGGHRGAGPRPGPGGNAGFSGFGNDGVDFSDIFDGLFGGMGGAGGQRGPDAYSRPRGGGAPKGANVAYRLPVSFTDAATLAPQRITLADGKTIDLKLPNGVETGSQLRLSGKGQPGPGGHGDGIVTIDVMPHKSFTRDGDTVLLDLPISLKEAVKGGKIKVPTVDGAVMLTVKPGSNSGQQLRLKGKGFHSKTGSRGDQIVTFQIMLPDKDEALIRFVEGWSGDENPRKSLDL